MRSDENSSGFQPMRGSTVVAVIGALLVVAVVSVWLLLHWFGSGQPTDQARLDTLRLAGQIVLGTGGLAALWVTLRRQRSTELTLQHQREVAASSEADAVEQRITDLYFKAAEQLGSDKAPVRLAGLYALERLGNDNPSQRANITALLCGYLRMPIAAGDEKQSADQELQVRTTIQHILKRRTGRSPEEGPRWLNSILDLRGAFLDQLDLAETDLKSVDLSGASIAGPLVLRAADLSGDLLLRGLTVAVGVDASCVKIRGSLVLSDSEFEDSVDFIQAHVYGNLDAKRCKFATDADFQALEVDGDVDFTGSAFDAVANFGAAQVKGTFDFSRASFGGYASFKGGKFRNYAIFAAARFDDMANFSEVSVGGKARFNTATFAGFLDFTESKIKGSAEFNKVSFVDATEFGGTVFESGGWFFECTFGSSADFKSTDYFSAVDFRKAKFAEVADFGGSTFHSPVHFSKSANVDLEDAMVFGTWRSSWPKDWHVQPQPDDGRLEDQAGALLVRRPFPDPSPESCPVPGDV